MVSRAKPVVCALALALAACQRPDDDGLGLDREKPTAPLLDKLTDPDALLGALGQAGAAVDKLGPRGFDLSRTFELTQGKTRDRVEEVFHFDSDGKRDFHIVHELGHPGAVALAPARGEGADATRDKVDPSAQGMEAIATAAKVYVRPRFGRFVERRPEPGELDRLRELAEQQLADDLEVLRGWLAISDAGNGTVLGRSTRVLKLSRSASPRAIEAHDDPRKGWRAGVKVAELAGELQLDAQTGVPVAGRVDARYEIPRPAGAVTAHLQLTLVPRTASAITPPTDAVASPTRPHPVVERNQLLQGLAPPTGTQAARAP